MFKYLLLFIQSFNPGNVEIPIVVHSSFNPGKYLLLYIQSFNPGNGDILSYEDYNNNLEQSGAAGCMIARSVNLLVLHFATRDNKRLEIFEILLFVSTIMRSSDKHLLEFLFKKCALVLAIALIHLPIFVFKNSSLDVLQNTCFCALQNKLTNAVPL